MQKNVLAPGESTVVELIFNTGIYKGKVGKSARVLSSDSSATASAISFSANVFASADTAARIWLDPERIEFDQKTKKISLELANRGREVISLEPIAGVLKELKLKIKDHNIAPDKTGKIEFEWKGEFPQNDLKKTITFAVHGSNIDRLSIPVVVKGTSPQPQPARATSPTVKPDGTTLKDAIKQPSKPPTTPAGK